MPTLMSLDCRHEFPEMPVPENTELMMKRLHKHCRTRHAPLLQAIVLAVACLGPTASLVAQQAASDTVHVWDQDGEGQTQLRGTILAYDRNMITLMGISGRQQQIASARVARIESHWEKSQLEADEAFAAREFEEAGRFYRQALETEMRGWARHRLIAQVAWCQQAAGQWADAGKTFLSVVMKSNPNTPYFDAIPLAWTIPNLTPQMEQLGKSWLVDEQSNAANLVGASWLLATEHREQAIRVLKGLAVSQDRQIAFLAETQLWRTQVPIATEATITSWEKMLQRMPAPLRAGPFHLLGQALWRTGRKQDAMIAWMRVPLQYPRHRLLAAESLLSAARRYQEMEKRDQATTLYRELTRGYPGTIAAQAAQDQLKKLLDK